jgi:hypothetical protein
MTKQELVAVVMPLVKEPGRNWEAIATSLNRKGITTIKGDAWTANNLRVFVSRNLPRDLVEDSPVDAREIAQESVDNSPLPTLSQALAEWLDGAALADLRSLLEEWRASRVLPKTRGPVPMFKAPRRNSGFHINAEILKRAAVRVESDRAGTGGSLSKLVELLLWEFLGRPEDVIEKPKTVEAGTDA